MMGGLPMGGWDLHPDNPAGVAYDTVGRRRHAASKRDPCPVCAGVKRCATTDSGAVLCHNCPDARHNPDPHRWRWVKTLAKDMGGLWVPLTLSIAATYPPRRIVTRTAPILKTSTGTTTAHDLTALFDAPPNLTQPTLQEWQASLVRPDIILSNVREHPQDGWLVCGIDLDTATRRRWYQWKPRYKGFDPARPKYLSLKGQPLEPLLLDIPSSLWREMAHLHACPITPQDEQLGFWHWVARNPQLPVIITEGAKKAGALLTACHIAVSIPGVSTCRNGGILHPWLATLAQDRVVHLLFDNDILTKDEVRAALCRLSGLMSRAGALVQIIELPPGPAKGADDFLVVHGTEALTQCIAQARPYLDWMFGTERTPAGVAVVEVHQQWIGSAFPSLEQLPEVLLVRSYVGSGKTQGLVELVNRAQRVLVITHRQSLARQHAARLSLACYLAGGYSADKLVVCADSLCNLNIADFDLVLIDESEQVLRHLTGDTIKSRLDESLQVFLGVLARARHIIALDADLGLLTFSKLARPGKTTLLHNTYQPGGRAFLRHPTRKHLQARLFECLTQGENIAYASNSRKEIERMEAVLQDHFPDKTILAIHSGNSAAPEIQEFLDQVNQRVPSVDVLLYSPTVGTGVSIDVRHFDRVLLCAAAGTTLPTDLYQQQGRVRQPKTTEVEFWVDGRYYRRAASRKFIQGAFDLAEQFTTGELPSPPSDRRAWFSDLYTAVKLQEARGLIALPEAFEHVVRSNGHTITDAAAMSADGLSCWGERTRLSAAQQRQRRIAGICAAVDLSPGQFKHLENQLEATGYLPPQRHHELHRYRLRTFYGQEVTLALVLADREGKLRRELLAFENLLTPDPDLRDKDKAEFIQYREHRNYHLLKKTILSKLLTAAELGWLMDPSGRVPQPLAQEFTAQSPGIQSFLRLCQTPRYRSGLYAAFKLTVPGNVAQNPIQFLGILLKRLGLRLGSQQRRESAGDGELLPSSDGELPAGTSGLSQLKLGASSKVYSGGGDSVGPVDDKPKSKPDNRRRFYWVVPESVSTMRGWLEHRHEIAVATAYTTQLVQAIAQELACRYGQAVVDEALLYRYLGELCGPMRVCHAGWIEQLSEDALVFKVHDWARTGSKH